MKVRILLGQPICRQAAIRSHAALYPAGSLWASRGKTGCNSQIDPIYFCGHGSTVESPVANGETRVRLPLAAPYRPGDEMANMPLSESGSCGFKSRPGHQISRGRCL